MHGKPGLRTLRSSLGVTYWLFLLRQTLIFGISFEAEDHIYDRMWQGFWDFVFRLPQRSPWPVALSENRYWYERLYGWGEKPGVSEVSSRASSRAKSAPRTPFDLELPRWRSDAVRARQGRQSPPSAKVSSNWTKTRFRRVPCNCVVSCSQTLGLAGGISVDLAQDRVTAMRCWPRQLDCKNLSVRCLIADSFLARDADFEFARPSSLPYSARFWIVFLPSFVPASIVPSMIPRDGLLDSERISPHATVSWRSCAFDRRPSADRVAPAAAFSTKTWFS